MNNFLWFAVWSVAMAALFGGYVFIVRRHQCGLHETIRQMAVYVPVNTAATHGNSRTFTCSHFSVGNVQSASCGICGPLPVAA